MKRPDPRKRTRFGCWLLLSVPLIVVAFAAWQQRTLVPQVLPGALTPTLPQKLTRVDVLPTLTPEVRAPLRQIIFPQAQVVSSIVRSVRVGNSWETRYLG